MASQVLFFCTGNICRSPVAEALSRLMFGHLGLIFCSAGLDAPTGRAASRESEIYALESGASLADHASQPFSPELLDGTAWVIGMTRSHAAIFRSRYGKFFQGSVGLLGAPGIDLGKMSPSPDAEEVDDPYGGSRATYHLACDKIRRLLAGWESCFSELAEGKDTAK